MGNKNCANCMTRSKAKKFFPFASGKAAKYYLCEDCSKDGNRFFKCECGMFAQPGFTRRSGQFSIMICPKCHYKTHKKCSLCGSHKLKTQLIGNRCNPCVEGSRRPDKVFFWSNINTVGSPESENNVVHSKRAYGVELESNSTGIRYNQTLFSSVKDGSISGQEFVSPILYGDHGALEIKKICDLKPDYGSNCGFHLHLDASGMKWWDVVSIGRGYSLLQPILFQMVPEHRRGNRHCQAITTPYFLINKKEHFLSMLYNKVPKQKVTSKYAEKRYEFLNTHAFFYMKTIEMRLHEGTFDYEGIIDWINFNQALFDYFTANKILPSDDPFDILNKALSEDLIEYFHGRIETYCTDSKLADYCYNGFKQTSIVKATKRTPQTIENKKANMGILVDKFAPPSGFPTPRPDRVQSVRVQPMEQIGPESVAFMEFANAENEARRISRYVYAQQRALTEEMASLPEMIPEQEIPGTPVRSEYVLQQGININTAWVSSDRDRDWMAGFEGAPPQRSVLSRIRRPR